MSVKETARFGAIKAETGSVFQPFGPSAMHQDS
jgi:hypothetical protein